VRIQAFALDYLYIAGYLALLLGLGLIFDFLFPDGSRIVFSNPYRASLRDLC
jgi:hypothetical protein